MAKGSSFERDISVKLSLWWTEGKREDVFWRSTTSGARATVRAKDGKTTSGSYGDITAIDPIGQPLMDLITFELKRGYSKHTPIELVESAGACQWAEFVDKAVMSHLHAGSAYWAIIAKRDRKKVMIWTPTSLITKLFVESPLPRIDIYGTPAGMISGIEFDQWLNNCKPSTVKYWVRKL